MNINLETAFPIEKETTNNGNYGSIKANDLFFRLIFPTSSLWKKQIVMLFTELL